MENSAEQLRLNETKQRLLDEQTITRTLTEVDHLNRLRNQDGSHNQAAIDGLMENLVPAVKEAAIPHAVSTTYQVYREGKFYWLDKTAEEAAVSGRLFHRHPAALDRVEIEEAEARNFRHLMPGMAQVFLSPKMSQFDAPYTVAVDEHLANDDMIRIHTLDHQLDDIKGKYMSSILLRHVPLGSWVAMLKDPGNIFGRSIVVDNELSALAVMKVHQELTVPVQCLPEGVISIAEAVLPYLDGSAQQLVRDQISLFRGDQARIHQIAINIASRWVAFESELADSLKEGYATGSILNFIHSVASELTPEVIDLIAGATTGDGRLRIDRQIATIIEQLRRNTLWTSAAVITGNKDVQQQIGQEAYQKIYDNEAFLQQLMYENISSAELAALEAQNNHRIAKQNVEIGGGCPGSLASIFRGSDKDQDDSSLASQKTDEEKSKKKWMKCPHCSAKVYDDPCAKVLACWDCRALVINGKVISKGNGGHKRQQEAALKSKQETELAQQVDEIFAERGIQSLEQERQKMAPAVGAVAVVEV